MKRRDFLTSAAALLVAAPAFASTGKPYKRGLVKSDLDAGKTVFLDFYTDWCTTCRAQAAAIRKLRAENPAYDQHMSFISIDWDKHAQSTLARNLNIPRRSTLVVLRGDQEIGRIVAGTRRADIQAMMDAGFSAATS